MMNEKNTQTNIMDQFINSDFVFGNIMLFCDFISLVALGRTCRRMKRCSDRALDKITKDNVSIENTVASVMFDVSGQHINTQLNGYWTPTISTRESMIEEALEFIELADFPHGIEFKVSSLWARYVTTAGSHPFGSV